MVMSKTESISDVSKTGRKTPLFHNLQYFSQGYVVVIMAAESALNVSSQKSVRVQCVTHDNKLHSCEDFLTEVIRKMEENFLRLQLQ